MDEMNEIIVFFISLLRMISTRACIPTCILAFYHTFYLIDYLTIFTIFLCFSREITIWVIFNELIQVNSDISLT